MSTASPWGATTRAPTRALADIMSEELLENEKSKNEELDYVYNEEDFMTAEEIAAKRLAEELSSTNEVETMQDEFLTDQERADRDFALALAAQDEENFQRMKKDPKYGNSKVNVCTSLDEHYSYGNYNVGQNLVESSDNSAAEELGAKLMGEDGGSGVSFKNGVANLDGTKVSKHDPLIDGLLNSKYLEDMDGSGDMCGLLISNSVSNKLKSFSQKKRQKGVYVGGGRVSAKDSRSTSESVLDERTRLLLFKLMQKQVFDNLHGVIKTGKESNVYHASKNATSTCQSTAVPLSRPQVDNGSDTKLAIIDNVSADEVCGNEDLISLSGNSMASSDSHYTFENSDIEYSDVAVKVFRTTLNEFGNRIDYVKGDHRFTREKHANSSNNKRKFIAQWVEKEFRNLCRATSKGLHVPRPLLFKDNVLCTEMIAEKLPDDETSTNHSTFMYSPQLKEVGELPLAQWESCYEQTLDIVKDLYQKCKLVHADLSEYNLILQNKEIVYALDFGQALDISHPEHKKYLLRDINAVNAFFKKKGVHIRDPQNTFDCVIQGSSYPEPTTVTGHTEAIQESC